MTSSAKPDVASDRSIDQPLAPAFEQRLFLCRGRYSRKSFWLWSLAMPLLLIAMLFPLAAMNDPKGSDGGPITLLILLSIPFVGLYCKLVIHRMHDIGWPASRFLVVGPLLILLPIFMFNQSVAAEQTNKVYALCMFLGSFAVFFGGFIIIGCLRGTKGSNDYGPDPLGEPKPAG